MIGMPGAGKSTVGILLAKELGLNFIDTDLLIQTKTGETLQQIITRQGFLALRNIEEQVILGLELDATVIATGGSAVYGESAMAHLKRNAMVVFIDVEISLLQKRIHNYESRGIARHPEQSFAALFKERHLLYDKYADICIAAGSRRPDELVAEIVGLL